MGDRFYLWRNEKILLENAQAKVVHCSNTTWMIILKYIWPAPLTYSICWACRHFSFASLFFQQMTSWCQDNLLSFPSVILSQTRQIVGPYGLCLSVHSNIYVQTPQWLNLQILILHVLQVLHLLSLHQHAEGLLLFYSFGLSATYALTYELRQIKL